jgi:N6-L-threonylcarbamoyladenine synthase
MYILGIETSCDETAASVVEDGRYVLSHTVTSSLNDHKKYGGIIPEIASRRQIEVINAVVETALAGSGLALCDIAAISVTQSPGLIGSLLVGISYARALSFATKKPLIEIDHIKAHLYANFLEKKERRGAEEEMRRQERPYLPAVGLIVSGGHSSLYHITGFTRYRLLGQTRDDAAGEAFDKVAKILGLGYPGGPAIDHLAKKGKNSQIRFPCADLPESFDFSFSGIKTAVLYYKQKYSRQKDWDVSKVAYAFQESVVSILVKKSIEACQKKNVRCLLVGGGVAANSALRQRLNEEAKGKGIQVFFPEMTFCLDNAAMVAGLGYHHVKKGK